MKVRANYQWKDDAESFERIRKTKKKNEEGFCHLVFCEPIQTILKSLGTRELELYLNTIVFRGSSQLTRYSTYDLAVVCRKKGCYYKGIIDCKGEKQLKNVANHSMSSQISLKSLSTREGELRSN